MDISNHGKEGETFERFHAFHDKTDAGFAPLIPKHSGSLSLSRERARVRAASTQSLTYILIARSARCAHVADSLARLRCARLVFIPHWKLRLSLRKPVRTASTANGVSD